MTKAPSEFALIDEPEQVEDVPADDRDSLSSDFAVVSFILVRKPHNNKLCKFLIFNAALHLTHLMINRLPSTSAGAVHGTICNRHSKVR